MLFLNDKRLLVRLMPLVVPVMMSSSLVNGRLILMLRQRMNRLRLDLVHRVAHW